MAVGWNHEIHARSDGARGGIWMNEVLPENVTAEDGWLYAEYQINDDSWVEQAYGDGTTLPTTWQGLSGGAVWHVWRPDSAEDRYEKMLVGVPFYEIRQPVERSMTIRVHHDLSLLRLLHRAGIAPPDAITDDEIASGLRAVAAPSQASASEPLISGLGVTAASKSQGVGAIDSAEPPRAHGIDQDRHTGKRNTMIPGTLKDVGSEALHALIDRRVPESKTLEYKGRVPGKADSESGGAVKTICAFANTAGRSRSALETAPNWRGRPNHARRRGCAKPSRTGGRQPSARDTQGACAPEERKAWSQCPLTIPSSTWPRPRSSG